MNSNIEVKIADTKEELEQTFKLRVDALVNNYNNDANATTDYSEYDNYAKQLICKINGEVVGCYRLVDSIDLKGHPFACEEEFDITDLKKTGKRILELSRACVKEEYRGGKVILRLFKGFIEYVKENNIDFVVGDASFYGVDREKYLKEFSYLHQFHPMNPKYNIKPLDGLDEMKFVHISDEEKDEVFNSLPPLVKAYIKFGACFSNSPYTDFKFKSVDSFVLVENNNSDTEFTKKVLK